MNENMKGQKRNFAVPIATMMVGAAAGAMATAMTDKNNRNKVKKILNGIRTKGEEISDMAAKKIDQVNREISGSNKTGKGTSSKKS